jgi:beta-1,4-mannosyl-glycoprotein beta-1,4-N-acetylglucosaminyltransferase
MVDIVNQNDKTICLNMIVKNESHIIVSTLKNILEHIKIDYWVISDTGSTDDTVDIIQDFFKEQGISGEMFHDVWKDFGHNRTKALEHAYDKSDYLFIFDADDLIHGDIPLPSLFDKDLYNVSFGNPVSYHRPILISNRMKWKYVGVLHESLVHIDPIKSDAYLLGNYHIESRRLGDRSKNPNKYVDDALILEKGFEEENTDMWLKYRYSYYCAQSYHDAGKLENAIEWYERTLTLAYSPQYKYCACIKAGDCYNALKQYSNAIDSWSKAYTYDRERLEGIVKIMEYFYNKEQHFMVSSLYNKFKHVKIGNAKDKIFLDYSKYHDFHYFASISGCYCDEHKSAYEACKYMLLNNRPNSANTIYNLKFYMKHFKEDDDNKSLLHYFVNYIMNPQIVFKEREHAWNIVNSIIKEQLPEKYNLLENSIPSSSKKNIDKNSKYASSKKILIYTGWMTHLWNESHLDEKALGGSEKAVAYLSREFPKDYEIIISGDVEEGTFDNRTYVHRNRLQPILDSTEFHTIIVSRYVCFFEKFKNSKCYKLIISAHDTHILSPGNNANHLLDMYNTSIDKVITLTPWHKSNIISLYPNIPSNKIEIINNGIDISQFHNNINQTIRNSIRKIKNKFIWSSRSERGLHIVLNLWGNILEKIPDATLDICSYGDFPKDDVDQQMLDIINTFDSITHHGKLNSIELYNLMAKSEYWLYTNTFPETSCITGMEMLMSEVICLYYPLAGLLDTVGEYGIPVKQGEEIETILNLSTEKKALMRENGKEYALSCSWKNRAEEWSTMLGLNKKKWVFYCSPHFETKMIQQYIDNLNYIYPEYFIRLTSDTDIIIKSNPNKITFVYEIFDTDIIKSLPNTQFSFLNTEPLNIPVRLEPIINILKLYPNFEYYDYSQSNLKILGKNEIDIQDKIYLPYKCSDEELEKLINLNKNTKKEFDFGILKASGGVITERRLKIVNFLKENNFTVNIIDGWADDRDMELAKCKIILNIHGNLDNTISYIFEHIRCDRLLESGFNILSEDSYHLNKVFIEKYPNLQFIIYEDFFNIEQMIECYNNKLGTLMHNQYVLNILNNIYVRINIPNEHINFLEKLSKDFYPENMIIYDIGSSVLHWTENASKIWKNSKIYVFDGMTEMKLFYDEYNKQNNTNYDYNVGVLCDEDYKRISFYQNDELSGGNSYYKEIGHKNSHTIFTENHIKHKIGMKLETIVKNKKIPMPDLIKIDVQGAELDILKGSMNVINHAKFLIVELQHTEYNEGAPLCNQTRDFLIENGWQVYAEKFCNNGPDADWCFINTRYNDINNQTQPKIIDCFIFYNELDMLTYRLNILNDVVDYFVLVESMHTFVGKEKPLFYQENKHLFEKFNHKIIHIIVDDFPHKYPNIDFEKKEQWNNEKFQRNCISRGIDKLELNNQDIIIIADVDEIPNPKILEQIKNKDIVVDINILELDFYYYNLHSKMDHLWHHSKILTFEKYNELNIGCDKIRFYNCPIIKNTGWHLSYFGNEKFIKNKLENFSHQEFNKVEFTDEKLIEYRIKNGKDLFDRPTSIITIPIEDNDNLPPDYNVYLTNFYTDSIQNIKSNLIKYSNLRDDKCRFENYDDYINWQIKTGLSFEKDNNKWMIGQRKCVEQNFDTMDRNSKILDICCGDGQGLKKFKEMGFKHIYGVEVCKDKINFAKQYGYTIYDCDICSGPFDIGDNYDCIYSSHTIEHVLNPEYTIRNIMTKLKNDGKFILILPYPEYAAGNTTNEHNFKVHCGVIPLGLHINDKGTTLINKIQQLGYKVVDYKFESYREPEIQLIITK